MKLRELIEHLTVIQNKMGGDVEVFQASDPEGNAYTTHVCARIESMRDGEPCHPDDGDDLCVVIWP